VYAQEKSTTAGQMRKRNVDI